MHTDIVVCINLLQAFKFRLCCYQLTLQGAFALHHGFGLFGNVECAIFAGILAEFLQGRVKVLFEGLESAFNERRFTTSGRG